MAKPRMFHHRSVVPRETEDAVVIGAGVVGIAVARELATKMTLVRSLCRSIPRGSQYLFCAGAVVNRHIFHLHLSSSSFPAPSPSLNPSTHTRMHGTRIVNDGGSRSYVDGTEISVRESSAVAGLWDCL